MAWRLTSHLDGLIPLGASRGAITLHLKVDTTGHPPADFVRNEADASSREHPRPVGNLGAIQSAQRGWASR